MSFRGEGPVMEPNRPGSLPTREREGRDTMLIASPTRRKNEKDLVEQQTVSKLNWTDPVLH